MILSFMESFLGVEVNHAKTSVVQSISRRGGGEKSYLGNLQKSEWV